MTFRYIGSKARVVAQIAGHIGIWREGHFVDAFCGTGAVAEAAADLGWPVRLNDQLKAATIVAAARLLSHPQAQFECLGGYVNAIELLQSSAPVQGFIWREYSPASKSRVQIERRYFTEQNAAAIDGMRLQINDWRTKGLIARTEEILLIADLLSALNRVANIAGTFGCFLSKWTPQAAQPIRLKARPLKQSSTEIATNNLEASAVPVRPEDLVYIDPPYTKRQYASYYHILETVAHGDEPVVVGVSGLRPWKSLASDYCYKVRALNALLTLITRLPAKRVLLSYSNEGHVPLDALKDGLTKIGAVSVHELATVGRYRPNVKASAARSSVSEFLMVIEKTIQPRKKVRELALA